MTEARFGQARLYDLGIDLRALRRLRDEIFVSIPDRPDTNFLSAPSYQVAVRDCLALGHSSFLLKIRPDMHRVVFSELQAEYHAHGVYTTEAIAGQRLVVTDEVYVRCVASSPREDRLSALSHYCVEVAGDGELSEGEYPLKPEFSLDPVVSVLAMEEEDVFAEVSPVVIQILDWIPRSRSATDLIPMRELGPVLKAYRSKK